MPTPLTSHPLTAVVQPADPTVVQLWAQLPTHHTYLGAYSASEGPDPDLDMSVAEEHGSPESRFATLLRLRDYVYRQVASPLTPGFVRDAWSGA